MRRLGLLLCVVAGMWAAVPTPAQEPAKAFPANLPLSPSVTFATLLNTIVLEYERPLPVNVLLVGALKGMLNELDRYSRYLPPDEMKRFMERTEGTAVGVGMTVAARNGRVVVTQVEPGGPADEAALYEGLHVRRVGEVTVSSMPLENAMKTITEALQGEPGTSVSVTLRDDFQGKDLTVTLERRSVASWQVFAWRAGEQLRPPPAGACFLKITHLSSNTPDQITDALAQQAVADCGHWVWDFRGNEGGDLDATKAVLSHLHPQGTPLYHLHQGPDKTDTLLTSDGLSPSWPVPLLILVDQATASGAELITQNLQRQAGVLVAGPQTTGKAMVQKIYPLSNEGGFALTVGRYVGLDGRSVSGEGISATLMTAWPAPTGESNAYTTVARGALALLNRPPAPVPPEGGDPFWERAATLLILRGVDFDQDDPAARTALWRAMRVAHHKRHHQPHAAQAVLAEEDEGLRQAVDLVAVAAREAPLNTPALLALAARRLGPTVTCPSLGADVQCLLLGLTAAANQADAEPGFLRDVLQALSDNGNHQAVLRLYDRVKTRVTPGFWSKEENAAPVIDSALKQREAALADELLRPLTAGRDPLAPQLAYWDGIAGSIKGDDERVARALIALNNDGEGMLQRRVGLLLWLAREALGDGEQARAAAYYRQLPLVRLRADIHTEALRTLWQNALDQGDCTAALAHLSTLATTALTPDTPTRLDHLETALNTALRCGRDNDAAAAAQALLDTGADARRRAAALRVLEALQR